MLRYCIENKITFTRSRAHKKNDSCYVEQKNYSVVRRAVGYLRYDTDCGLDILNELRRVLESEYIDDKIKEKLKKQYESLNPAELKRKISRLQEKLIKLNSLKKTLERNSIVDEKSYEYIYR